MNTYVVDKNLEINQVEPKLNERASAGYKVLEVLPTGGGFFAVVSKFVGGPAQQNFGNSD